MAHANADAGMTHSASQQHEDTCAGQGNTMKETENCGSSPSNPRLDGGRSLLHRQFNTAGITVQPWVGRSRYRMGKNGMPTGSPFPADWQGKARSMGGRGQSTRKPRGSASGQAVHAARQHLHNTLHLQTEEDAREAAYGQVGVERQLVEVALVAALQSLRHLLLLRRQFG